MKDSWTRELPTIDGFYNYYSYGRWRLWRVVKDGQGQLRSVHNGVTVAELGGYWLGPLPTPPDDWGRESDYDTRTPIPAKPAEDRLAVVAHQQ